MPQRARRKLLGVDRITRKEFDERFDGPRLRNDELVGLQRCEVPQGARSVGLCFERSRCEHCDHWHDAAHRDNRLCVTKPMPTPRKTLQSVKCYGIAKSTATHEREAPAYSRQSVLDPRAPLLLAPAAYRSARACRPPVVSRAARSHSRQ